MAKPGDNATAALIDSLNALLADYFALYQIGRASCRERV